MAGRRYGNNQRRKERGRQESFFDYTLLFIVLFLLAFGLVMLYSASSYDASLHYEGDATYFLRRQVGATALGIGAMILIANIPYHFWERFAFPMCIVSIALIFLVLTPLGYEANGARRWIRILGISIQPAEVAKIAVIVFLSSLICRMGRKVRSWKGFMWVLAMPAVMAVLVWFVTENMSSAIIILGIGVLMLFVACPDYKRFILLGILGVGAAVLIVYVIVQMSQSENASALGVRGTRILAWLDPEAYASGKGFQTLQALYAIGSGGIMGKGLGQSMQKLGFMPEAQNDMIFSIICEELGLFGAISILLMFILLIWRFMVIANNATDLFGSLLVVGVMGHVAIQVILNVAVVTNTIPNTGISLPFISYGGTSVLFQLAEIGLVLSVGKGIRFKDL
ncbi:MAG: putative lipid II flippase FtsW [Clostridium sp.]|nr:putative lipid II flippase FtsW [Clostridium sp.]